MKVETIGKNGSLPGYLIRMLLVLLLIWNCILFADAQDLTVHFLDVGQGLSILVECDGEVLIYDGGGRDTSDFVVSYLKKQGIDTIDYLISSHYHEDHLAGLIGCLHAFEVKNVICGDYVEESDLYTSFFRVIQDKGIGSIHPSVGDSYDLGSAVFTILSPAYYGEGSNNNSIGIRLVNGDTSFLFPGDAEYECEAGMVDSGLNLYSDVLCLAHHGSYNSTTSAFIEAVSPKVAVISCGHGNQFGHPHSEPLYEVESRGIALYRTDEQGTVSVTSDGKELIWDKEACNDYCYGSVEVYTDGITDSAIIQNTQESLNKLGYECGTPDGILGSATIAAIMAYQSDHGMEKNGAVTEELLGSLNQITETENLAEPETTQGEGTDYVLNKRSKKFHYPYCRSVDDMSEKNKQLYHGTREELITIMQYDPCKNCNP